MLIDCPWCGAREEQEFHYGGQAHVPYPQAPAELSDAQWADYLFFRDNPRGPFAERWVHSAGCRRWFNAVRDTATNEVYRVYAPEWVAESRFDERLPTRGRGHACAA